MADKTQPQLSTRSGGTLRCDYMRAVPVPVDPVIPVADFDAAAVALAIVSRTRWPNPLRSRRLTADGNSDRARTERVVSGIMKFRASEYDAQPSGTNSTCHASNECAVCDIRPT